MDPLYILKETLSRNLEKAGSSLEELEDALANGHDKVAEQLLKQADGLVPSTMFGGAMKSLSPYAAAAPSTFVQASVLGGAGAGLGLDAVEGSVEHQNKRLSDLPKQLKMLQRQIQQLEFENAYH